MTAISLRLPGRLAKDLEKLASTTERSKSYLIRKAVQEYLEEYADARMGMDRLLDRHDAVLTGAEMRKRLGL